MTESQQPQQKPKPNWQAPDLSRPIHELLDITAGKPLAIDADGWWYHAGTRFIPERFKMMQFFAKLLKRDTDGQYWVVTPVDRVRVDVADVPFIIVGMSIEGRDADAVISFRTNLDEIVTLGPDHALRLPAAGADGVAVPYVHVRDGLEARLNRSVYYELINHCQEQERQAANGKPERVLGIYSKNQFYVLGVV